MKIIAMLIVTAAVAAAQAAETPKDSPVSPEARRAAALGALKAVAEGLPDRSGLAESEDVVRGIIKDTVGLDWGQERKAWVESVRALLGAAREHAERAAKLDPPDVEGEARYLRIAAALLPAFTPEEMRQDGSIWLMRDRDEAVERWLFGAVPPALPPGKDLLSDDWTWIVPAGIESRRDDKGWHLRNTGDAAGTVALAENVRWADFRIRMDFTTNDKGFVLNQRTRPGSYPAAQFDLSLMLQRKVITADEAITLDFWVYGGRCRVVKDKPGGAAICAPAGAKEGGIALLLLPGSELHIRSLEAAVLREEK